MNDRADATVVEFEEAHGHVPEPVEVRTVIRALPQPRFAYGLQVADNINGNGDGRVQRGEQVTLYVTVKNISKVDSFEVQANLQNKSGAGVLLYDGRFRHDSIRAGEEWVVPFSFQVLPDFQDDKATVLFAVSDTELGTAVGQKVEVPLYEEPGPVKALPAKRVVSLSPGVEIRERPDDTGPVIGVVEGSFLALQSATSGDFERVNLGEGRPGWVAATAVELAQGQVSKEPPVAWVTGNAPPEIELLPPESYVTRGDVFRLRGKAIDSQRVRDLYISTGGHKVYYESNEGNANPKELAFDAEIPVHPGANAIMVVAREDNNSVTRQFLTVRRDAEDGSLMETTKFEGALLSNGGSPH
jgi:carboxyl-terminal processing protease